VDRIAALRQPVAEWNDRADGRLERPVVFRVRFGLFVGWANGTLIKPGTNQGDLTCLEALALARRRHPARAVRRAYVVEKQAVTALARDDGRSTLASRLHHRHGV